MENKEYIIVEAHTSPCGRDLESNSLGIQNNGQPLQCKKKKAIVFLLSFKQ